MIPIDKIPSGQLLQEFRDVSSAIGKNPGDLALVRRCDLLQAEIDRRMAW